jgi:hypothetical protein
MTRTDLSAVKASVVSLCDAAPSTGVRALVEWIERAQHCSTAGIDQVDPGCEKGKHALLLRLIVPKRSMQWPSPTRAAKLVAKLTPSISACIFYTRLSLGTRFRRQSSPKRRDPDGPWGFTAQAHPSRSMLPCDEC